MNPALDVNVSPPCSIVIHVHPAWTRVCAFKGDNTAGFARVGGAPKTSDSQPLTLSWQCLSVVKCDRGSTLTPTGPVGRLVGYWVAGLLVGHIKWV
jgi:hypothetical protein